MLLNKNKYAVLKEFLIRGKGVYGSSIAKRKGLNQKTVSNILNLFEKEGILRFEREGKNKVYFLNEENVFSKSVIQMLEIEKKGKFLEKNKKLCKLFESLVNNTRGIVVVFGSYSKYTNKKDSDLDLFLIGEIGELELLEESFGIEINVVKFDKNKFDTKDNFVKEIIENHIVLKGLEEFVDLIW